MLKTDDAAQFIAISGLLNYCKSQEECKECDMHKICNVLTGDKKLAYVIDKVIFKLSDNEWIRYKGVVSAEEEEDDD